MRWSQLFARAVWECCRGFLAVRPAEEAMPETNETPIRVSVLRDVDSVSSSRSLCPPTCALYNLDWCGVVFKMEAGAVEHGDNRKDDGPRVWSLRSQQVMNNVARGVLVYSAGNCLSKYSTVSTRPCPSSRSLGYRRRVQGRPYPRLTAPSSNAISTWKGKKEKKS